MGLADPSVYVRGLTHRLRDQPLRPTTQLIRVLPRCWHNSSFPWNQTVHQTRSDSVIRLRSIIDDRCRGPQNRPGTPPFSDHSRRPGGRCSPVRSAHERSSARWPSVPRERAGRARVRAWLAGGRHRLLVVELDRRLSASRGATPPVPRPDVLEPVLPPRPGGLGMGLAVEAACEAVAVAEALHPDWPALPHPPCQRPGGAGGGCWLDSAKRPGRGRLRCGWQPTQYR